MTGRGTPRQRLTNEDDWPNGKTTDPAALRAQEMARNLTTAQENTGLSMRRIAENAGVSVSTVHRVLNGQVFADLHVMTALETALNMRLLGEYQPRNDP